MRNIEHNVDLCVVGGGIAGLCAAVSAARNGIKVALMQDRPVLGGNASSEIRMWICGAHGKFNRESGIVEELMLENYYRNQSHSYSIWDSVLYEKARFEENITLLLNCTCMDAENDGDHIVSVTGWQMTTETKHKVYAKYFADCSGDSILAPLTGADCRIGREAKSEYGESIPPDTADKKTMGMSVLLQARETDRKQEFIPPDWAYVYENDDALKERDHSLSEGCNFWWIELGGDKDSIHDTEDMRDELLKIAFGVWDHIKNTGDHGADNWQLDWVGFLPGKRESRRYIGKTVITENDVKKGGIKDKAIAYAGWSMDDHFPQGFYYEGGHPTIYHPAPSPWMIPFGAIVSASKDNLLFAGRNISVTHAALSSSRVMATCGLLGQALGTAAAIAVKANTPIYEINTDKLQQQLLWDDSYIPCVERKLSRITESAKYPDEVLRNGHDREDADGLNRLDAEVGEPLEFNFADKDNDIAEMRIVFDSTLDRNYKNMPCRFVLKEPDYTLPETLVKSFTVTATDERGNTVTVADVKANRRRLVKIPVNMKCSKIVLTPTSTHGCDKAHIFSVDFR